MKTLSIAFSAPAIAIPMNYHHEVQSLLYRLLHLGGDALLHDSGAAYGARRYKLFTFSSLRGSKQIVSGKLVFERMVYLDVRSVRDEFSDMILNALSMEDALTLFGQPLKAQSVKTDDAPVTVNSLTVKMLSPLTIHSTDDNGKSHYYTPLDKDFPGHIDANFKRKWTAYNGNPPVCGIELAVVNVDAKDKYVTTYKGIHINGWRGEYKLSGNPEHLNFLYYCGLGARNSDGFGMFEVI